MLSSVSPFHLVTARTQMSFHPGEQGALTCCYYGARLDHPDDALLSPEAEIPLLPTDLDARGAWGNMSGEYALDIVQADGMRSARLLCTECEILPVAEGMQARILLRDPVYPVEVLVTLTAHEQSDVIERETTVTNRGEHPVLLHRADSGCLRLRAGAYRVTTFRGGWAGESLLHEETIAPGNTLSVTSETGSRAAQEGTPGFLVSAGRPATEETGRVYLGALAWPGDYDLAFKHAADGTLFVRAGMALRVPYRLDGAAAFSLPRLLLTYSNRGKGRASRNMHRWARQGGIRDGDTCRPTVLNSWEGAHFTFDEELLHQMISDTAELGLETFVLDDGWFANKYPRDNDRAGLGDWEANRAKLPHGLTGLAAEARRHGIRFGLWIEPEMVNPYSELFIRHPEWVLQLPNRKLKEERHQLVLDLANPDVRRYILCTLDKLLTENPGITYLKWDCNRKISDAGSTWLGAEWQGNLAVEYAKGYEEIVSTIAKLHPGVTLQACASGGGRADYGTLRHHHEFWVSDNTDPVERLRMQWSLGHLFPAMAMGAHVTASPNLQTGRETPLKFRLDAAMSARLGFELQPGQLSKEERAAIHRAIELDASLRPIVQLGELYRLQSPMDEEACALLYRLSEEGRERALLFAWQWGRMYTERNVRVPVAGLDPAARYAIRELLPDETGFHSSLAGHTASGGWLMEAGLPVQWNRPLQSALWLLEKTS